MVFSMDPNKTIVRKQIDAIQFGSVLRQVVVELWNFSTFTLLLTLFMSSLYFIL